MTVACHIIASTGWSWEYVEWELDLPRIAAMMAYWREFPPVHVLVAKFIGYEVKEQKGETPTNSDEDIRRLASIFPQG